jgi:hypothetical protein
LLLHHNITRAMFDTFSPRFVNITIPFWKWYTLWSQSLLEEFVNHVALAKLLTLCLFEVLLHIDMVMPLRAYLEVLQA